jgi:hypothetical protein
MLLPSHPSPQFGVRWQSVASTPLFSCARDQPQYDAKAVSTSYARKLASDSATALQVQQPPDS